MELKTPISEEVIRSLKVGDVVEITGLIHTGRDAVHKYLHDGGKLPVQVAGSPDGELVGDPDRRDIGCSHGRPLRRAS